MADHLALPEPHHIASRRLPGNPVPTPVVRTFAHGQRLSERLRFIAREDLEFEGPGAESEQGDTRLVLKFKGKTRLPNGPLNGLNFVPLGEDEDWTFYVLSDSQARTLLAQLLNDYMGIVSDDLAEWDHPKTWATLIDNLEDIEIYGPEDRLDPELLAGTYQLPGIVDILIWPSSDAEQAAERISDVREAVYAATQRNSLCRELAHDPRPDRTLLRVRTDSELLEELSRSAIVERLRTPLRSAIALQDLANSSAPSIGDIARERIGIIDGLVSSENPLTGPPILVGTRTFPNGHVPGTPALKHGTAVAGAAAWGDLDPLVLGAAMHHPHPIASAVVLEETSENTQMVVGAAHTTIESAIRWLVNEQGCRVVSLSVNYDYPASATALREELTYTIDLLAKDLNVVVVVSAGNRTQLHSGHWLDDYPGYLAQPEARVAPPGDAAIAVTVGSVARRHVASGSFAASKIGIAPPHGPSPFTRVGPTRGTTSAGVLKPEFYAHGGNWAWDHETSSCDALNPSLGTVVAIAPRGPRLLGTATGTSYAAPAVAHQIARIAERYPTASANTLRALTALSARHLDVSAVSIDPLRLAAYGEPNADRVLESSPQRVFLIYEGEINTGQLEVHRLPIPSEYADGIADRHFRVAMAFDPPVRRRRKEYIAGTMWVDFVRGLSLEEVEATYQRQPTPAEVAQDPRLRKLELPSKEFRPGLTPGVSRIESNTLIRRDFVGGAWDPDHRDYFVLVGHDHSPWTAAQKKQYLTQRYTLAVEISDETRTTLNLYATIKARLRARDRLRTRA